MKWQHRTEVGLGVVGLALLTGCVSTEPPVCDISMVEVYDGPALIPQHEYSVTPIPLNAVQIIDPAIVRKIVVHNTYSSRSAAGQVNVESRLQNCTTYPLQLEARTHFFQQDGSSAEPVSAWKRLYLAPKTIGGYFESSLAPLSPHGFYIELREAG